MLTINVQIMNECWDENKEEFVSVPVEEVTLHLEHSLVSLSKWESKWHKAFLSRREKTDEETLDYIKCMTLDDNIPDEVYYRLTKENIDSINKYIEDPMSAVRYTDPPGGPHNNGGTTYETLYYMMFSNGIPIEWETRHLNSLISLIKMFALKNSPKKKMSPSEIASRHAAINAANRARFNTKG